MGDTRVLGVIIHKRNVPCNQAYKARQDPTDPTVKCYYMLFIHAPARMAYNPVLKIIEIYLQQTVTFLHL